MNGGANKNGNYKDNSFSRFFKLFIGTSLISGLAFVIILSGLVQIASSKSLNGSSLAGEHIGNLDAYEASNKLNQVIVNLQNKNFTLGNSTTNLNELGLKINTQNLESQLFVSNLSFAEKAVLVFNSLSIKNDLDISFIENPNSTQKIDDLTKDLKTEPKNAHFAHNNKLEVIADTTGKSINTKETINNIATALSNNSDSVELSYNENLASITTADLEKVYTKVQNLITGGLTVAHNSKTWNFSESDILKWVSITKKNNTLGVNLNDKLILTEIDKLAANVNIATQKELKKPDGTVTQQGKDGLTIDKNQTLANIKQSLESGNKQALVATSAVKFASSTVYPDSTAGLYSSKYIQVSLRTQTLYQYEGETLVAKYTISSGASRTPTPRGTFTVNSKHPRAWSSSAKLWMPYWMAFIGSTYGLHELPEWPGGYKEGQNHLGIPVSHGCIRLGVGDAKKIYDWVEVGTPVVIN